MIERDMKATDAAVVFVTNDGYLAPSLQAALQLTEQGIHEIADIIIFVIDVAPKLVDTLTSSVDPAIKIIPLADRSYICPRKVVLLQRTTFQLARWLV
jgi:hypothetical protein